MPRPVSDPRGYNRPVPRQLWARAIEGDAAELLVQRATGRLVVSTRRVLEETAPAGVERMASVRGADPPTYVNQLAERCLALGVDGEVLWEHRGLRVVGEAPDGGLVAIDDALALVTLAPGGEVKGRRPMPGPWGIAGWTDDGELLLASEEDFPSGSVWMHGAVHAVAGGNLVRFDAGGTIVAEVAIPEAPLREKWRQENAPHWPEDLVAGTDWDLVADVRRGRLLATSWALPAWVVAIALDGAMEWAALLGVRCCNFRCLVLAAAERADDTLVHASSCGQRLSFLRPDGVVFRTHDLQHPPDELFSPREGEVAVPLQGWGVLAFDARGEPTWAVEAPGAQAAAGQGGILQVVTRQPAGQLELRAFDVGRS